jgi:H+-transporting ATPase
MTIAYDNADPDPKPVRWDMHRVWLVSGALGFLSVAQSFGVLYVGIRELELDALHVQTMLFLQLVVGGHLMLFLNRAKKSFLHKPFPSGKLFGALVATQIFVVFMTGFGWLVPPLPWELIGWVWAYNLAWMVVLDLVKLGAHHLLATRGRPQGIFAHKAETFLRKLNWSARPYGGVPAGSGNSSA